MHETLEQQQRHHWRNAPSENLLTSLSSTTEPLMSFFVRLGRSLINNDAARWPQAVSYRIHVAFFHRIYEAANIYMAHSPKRCTVSTMSCSALRSQLGASDAFHGGISGV